MASYKTSPATRASQVDEWDLSSPVYGDVAIRDLRTETGEAAIAESLTEETLPPSACSVVWALMGAMRAGTALPPIIVRRDGRGYVIEDGHHRAMAAHLIGATTIPAVWETE